jgi:hypothetical protein
MPVMHEATEERGSTTTAWAVYIHPYAIDLDGETIPGVEFARDFFGRTIPEILLMLDGSEKVNGRCLACERVGFRGKCPGSQAHAFTQWQIESTRNFLQEVEMEAFRVPERFNREGRIAFIKRTLTKRERDSQVISVQE